MSFVCFSGFFLPSLATLVSFNIEANRLSICLLSRAELCCFESIFRRLSELKILFPNHPEGPEWFFQQMYIYSVGVPIYLVHVLRELVDLRKTGKNTDLSDNDMETMIDSIPMNTSVLIIRAHMSPETMNVFCSMLLAAVLELRIKQDSFVTINGRERFLLDVANVLGFYCIAVSAEEKGLS
jgi:hypothetical protein